jgi:hypothetical protein
MRSAAAAEQTSLLVAQHVVGLNRTVPVRSNERYQRTETGVRAIHPLRVDTAHWQKASRKGQRFTAKLCMVLSTFFFQIPPSPIAMFRRLSTHLCSRPGTGFEHARSRPAACPCPR